MPGTERNFDWGGEADEVPSEEEAAAIEADQTPVVAETPAESVVAEIYEEPQAKPPRAMNKAFDRIQKAQERLDIAACYRLLLDGSLFETNTPAAQKVDNEIREFVCQRLEVLMGVQPEKTFQAPVALPFSENEIKVLKAISKAAEKKILAAAQAPKEPEPVVAPAPTLKKVSNEERQPQAAPEPKPQPQQVQPRRFAQPQLKRPGQPQQQPQSRAGMIGTGDNMINEALVPYEYRADPTLKIVDGKAMVHGRNRDGQLMYEYNPKTKKQDKPLYKNITLVAKPAPTGPQPKPMLPIEQMMGVNSPLMQEHANSMLGFAERRAKGIGIGAHLAGALVQTFNPNQSSNNEEGFDHE